MASGRLGCDWVSSVRFDVCSVDFHADGLADQIYRKNQPRLRRVFSNEPSHDALERAVGDFNHHALMNHRARVILQLTADKETDAVELEVRDHRWLAFK